ncbi:MAG: S-methyl-5-thioribose-1-phosphate isomerase [Syntrophomonadaceae bacterium]|nr:S-methyl-5-thioribose-1-phosphate isomerase [Syntrophomonadaceae bacterium]
MRNIFFQDNTVMILDQTRLPGQVVYETCHTPYQVADAIKKLKVRGAPLIGIAAAFGLAMAIQNFNGFPEDLDEYFHKIKNLMASTRPTAVNLFWALERMQKTYDNFKHLDKNSLALKLIEEADIIAGEDLCNNKSLGEYGNKLIGDGARVMTICNAGSLATCGYGTALGVIRAAASQQKIKMVWICETRPVLQGARLTVWELLEDNIPVTLITDSMAGYVMSLREVDAVIVGADRIAANGDTANKIGTYSLAVLAKEHHIPFYVAAPVSTIDYSLASGKGIPIEERDHDEVRRFGEVYLTVPQVRVFNPAFDITSHNLITCIITEKGIVRPPFAQGLEAIRRKD